MLNHFSRASHWICLRLWWEIDLTCFPAWPHVAFVRLSILERGVGPYLRGCWAGGACQSSARVTTAEGHLTRGAVWQYWRKIVFLLSLLRNMKVFGNLCQEHLHSHLISHSQPQNKQFLHHLPLGPALWRSEFLASLESFCWSLISSNCKNSPSSVWHWGPRALERTF